jgi:hypothetical protein
MRTIAEERGRWYRMRAEALELELKREQGELVPREVMEKRLRSFVVALRGKIKAAGLPAAIEEDLLAEVADMPRYLDGGD